jgi:nitrate/TMAO reductase-like tetraheme cytochrome c subunit
MNFFLPPAVFLLLLGSLVTMRAQDPGKASGPGKVKDESCLACHSNATMAKEVDGKKISLFIDAEKLKRSAHGDRLACVDCHVAIEGSTKRRTLACGQCHVEEAASYARNYPGKEGMAEKVQCQACHGGAHEMLAPAESQSPVNRANVPATCGKCHVGMEERFLAGKHGPGIAPRQGAAPVCIDCHVIHDHQPAISLSAPRTGLAGR